MVIDISSAAKLPGHVHSQWHTPTPLKYPATRSVSVPIHATSVDELIAHRSITQGVDFPLGKTADKCEQHVREMELTRGWSQSKTWKSEMVRSF
jgi:hypothetical protein